jgi:translation elongation factor EF-G
MKFFGQFEITYGFRRHLGPRFQHADVTIQFLFHDKYEFSSLAKWSQENYDDTVERGIKDGLSDLGYDLEKGIKITLTNIGYHEVDSSEWAFYLAAKCAAKSIADLIYKQTSSKS